MIIINACVRKKVPDDFYCNKKESCKYIVTHSDMGELLDIPVCSLFNKLIYQCDDGLIKCERCLSSVREAIRFG